MPHRVDVNVFNGLHGRALPAALADPDGQPVAHRRGLQRRRRHLRRGGEPPRPQHPAQPRHRRVRPRQPGVRADEGQPSPTSDPGWAGSLQRSGVIAGPFPPLAAAIALGCGFVARGLAADIEFTADLMVRAIAHKGFALVDVLQPCVTFNKKNTYEWYGRWRTRSRPGTTRPTGCGRSNCRWNREERIPIGVLYRREDRPALRSCTREWATRRCTRARRRRTRCATSCGSGSSRSRNGRVRRSRRRRGAQ